MKNFLTAILILAFAAFGAVAFSTRADANFSAANPAAESLPVPAKTLYSRNCARCHGADGKSETELGQTMDAPDLTAKKTSVERNVRVITNGIGGMPSFKKKLKRAEIVALANYVRSL